MKKRFVLAFMVVTTTACGNSAGGYACPALARPGVIVEVRDAATGGPLGGARGTVTEGAYVDFLVPYRPSSTDPVTAVSLKAADNRPGRYSIEVKRDGYQTWTLAGVVADRDECGVRTTRVRADLRAAP